MKTPFMLIVLAALAFFGYGRNMETIEPRPFSSLEAEKTVFRFLEKSPLALYP